MTLFDSFERSDSRPSGHAEPPFRFYNRCARPEVERIRNTLQRWFSRYPKRHQADLRGRFRSPQSGHHRGSFFELFLHELLVALGSALVEVHPAAAASSRTNRSDFYTRSTRNESCYIEAAVATGETSEEAAARTRMAVVYDVLDKLDSPNFFIEVESTGQPRTSPSAQRIAQFLREKVTPLDPDEVAKQVAGGHWQHRPQWRYEEAGGILDFSPIPKSVAGRSLPGLRTLGAFLTGAQIDPGRTLRDALIAKAARYGNLDGPYVIAVNSIGDWPPDEERGEVLEALFGSEAYVVTQRLDGRSSEPEFQRRPDGLWLGPSGPRHTGVSAVLLARVFPSNVPKADIRLYHNPRAKHAYAGPLTQLPQGVLRDGYMQLSDGQSLGDILRLSPRWPYEDPESSR